MIAKPTAGYAAFFLSSKNTTFGYVSWKKWRLNLIGEIQMQDGFSPCDRTLPNREIGL